MRARRLRNIVNPSVRVYDGRELSAKTDHSRRCLRRAGQVVHLHDREPTAARTDPRVHRPANREHRDRSVASRTPRQPRRRSVPVDAHRSVPVDARRTVVARFVAARAVAGRLTTTASVATRRLIRHASTPRPPSSVTGSDGRVGRVAGENGRFGRRARGLCLASGYGIMASGLSRSEAIVSGDGPPGAFLSPAPWRVETTWLPAGGTD